MNNNWSYSDGRTSPLTDEEERMNSQRREFFRKNPYSHDHSKKKEEIEKSSSLVKRNLPPGSKIFQARCACGSKHFLFSIPKGFDIQNLITEKQNVQRTLDQCRSKISNLTSKMKGFSDLEEEHEKCRNENTQLKNQISNLNESLRDNLDKFSKVSKHYEDEKHENVSLTNANVDLKGQVSDLVEKYKISQSQLKAWRQKYNEISNENKSLYEQLSGLKTNKNKEIDGLLSLQRRDQDERERKMIDDNKNLTEINVELSKRNKTLQKKLDSMIRHQEREIQEMVRAAKRGSTPSLTKMAFGGGNSTTTTTNDIMYLLGASPSSSSSSGNSKTKRGKKKGRKNMNDSFMSNISTASSYKSGFAGASNSFRGGTTFQMKEIDSKKLWNELKRTIQALVDRNVELARQLMQYSNKKNNEAEKWAKKFQGTKEKNEILEEKVNALKEIQKQFEALKEENEKQRKMELQKDDEITKLKKNEEMKQKKMEKIEEKNRRLEKEIEILKAQITKLEKKLRAQEIRMKSETLKSEKRLKQLSRIKGDEKMLMKLKKLKMELKEKNTLLDKLKNNDQPPKLGDEKGK